MWNPPPEAYCMLALALPTNFSVLWSQWWRTSRSPEVRNHSCLAHTRTLKALIVRRRFGNRSVSTGNMPVFLVVMYVDKEFGHMFKFRCSRAVICDNMSFTYAYLYIYVNIFMYIYTYILVHIYKYTHICVARRTVLLFIAVCILFRAYGLFVRYRARAYDNMYLIYKFFVQGNLRCLFTCLWIFLRRFAS